MTWLRKMRPVLLALGLAIGIGTLIGARNLANGSNGEPSTKAGDSPKANGGPVVLGLVDTDPQPVPYGLPPVLQSGTVSLLHVKEGDDVKVDQPLYEFDATLQKQDVKRAEAAIATADTKVKEAREFVKQHTANIKLAENAAKAAERKVGLAKQYYDFIDSNLEKSYKADGKPPETWKELKKSSADLLKANVDYDAAVHDKDLAEQRRDQLKDADPTVKVKEAEAAVEQAKAELAKAKIAVDLCVVKARTAGTIEQVSISPGTTLGISTRTPALWLIPAGPRVVRAEVEAEFAHRVGTDIVGKSVTIYDHSDPKLTYTGVVRRVPPVFLLKRANAENFLGSDTRVIEAVIEVSDPSPAGRPPLRVGQRVRVNLGQ